MGARHDIAESARAGPSFSPSPHGLARLANGHLGLDAAEEEIRDTAARVAERWFATVAVRLCRPAVPHFFAISETLGFVHAGPIREVREGTYPLQNPPSKRFVTGATVQPSSTESRPRRRRSVAGTLRETRGGAKETARNPSRDRAPAAASGLRAPKRHAPEPQPRSDSTRERSTETGVKACHPRTRIAIPRFL